MKPCVEQKEFLYEYRLIIDEFIKKDNKIFEEKDLIRRRKKNDIITQSIFNEFMNKLDDTQLQIKNETSNKLNILENKYTEFLKSEFNLDDEKIDDRDLMLLSCGLIIDKEHVQELNKKYKDNSKMQKILKEYKGEPNVELTIKNLSGCLQALKEFIENTNLGIHGKENCYWRIILENEVHLEAHLERFRRKIDK